MQCEALVALNDPEGHGTDEDVNDLCAAALYTCSVTATAAYAADKSVYDIRVGSTVGPTAAFAEYLNEESVLQSVGAPINFTSSSPMVLNEFNLSKSLYPGFICTLGDLANFLCRRRFSPGKAN
jgi:hypothetical protein